MGKSSTHSDLLLKTSPIYLICESHSFCFINLYYFLNIIPVFVYLEPAIIRFAYFTNSLYGLDITKNKINLE